MSVVHNAPSQADKLGDFVKLWVESTGGADQKAWSVGVRNMRSFVRLLSTPSLAGYSLGNQILIALQAEQMTVYPSRLGTMYQWATIGRAPVKDSRGVRVYITPERARANPNIHDEPIATNGGLARLFDVIGLQDGGKGVVYNAVWAGDSIPMVGGTIPKSVKVIGCENDVYTLGVTRLVGSAEVTETVSVRTPVEIVRALTGASGASIEDVRTYLDQALGIMGRREQAKKEVVFLFDVSQTVVTDASLVKEFPYHLPLDKSQVSKALTIGGYGAGENFIDLVDAFIEKEFRGEDAQQLNDSSHPLIKHYLREIALVSCGAKAWQDVDAKPLSRGNESARPQFVLQAIRQSWLHLSHKLELAHVAAQAPVVVAASQQKAAEPTAKRTLSVASKSPESKPVAPKFGTPKIEKAPEAKPVSQAVTLKPPVAGAPKFNPFGSTLARAKADDKQSATVVVKVAEVPAPEVAPAIKKPAFNPFSRAKNAGEADMSPKFG